MEVAEFSHSRFQRIGAIAGAVFVAGLFIPITTVGAWMLVSLVLDGESLLTEERLVTVAGFFVMTWMVVVMAQHLRYWYAYRTKYVLDSQGLQIEAKDGVNALGWHEIESAEYQPLFFLARLRSSKLQKPAILLLSTENRKAIDRTKLAQDLLQTQMGSRYRRRWLP